MARKTTAADAVAADFSAAVAERAYYKALTRGFEPGHELDDWLAAERELGAQLAAPKPSAKQRALRTKSAQ
jgi:hypothetical protein